MITQVKLDMNWEMLREQKRFLIENEVAEALGLLSLVDSIQDQAVDSNQATEMQVFGKCFKDVDEGDTCPNCGGDWKSHNN